MSGLARAPMAAQIMLQILTKVSEEDAKRRIGQLRWVQFGKATNRMGGRWIESIVKEPIKPLPRRGFYVVSTRQGVMRRVHGGCDVDGATIPLCKWKKGSKEGGFKEATVKAAFAEEAAVQLGSIFCPACLPLLIASDRVDVREHFDVHVM